MLFFLNFTGTEAARVQLSLCLVLVRAETSCSTKIGCLWLLDRSNLSAGLFLTPCHQSSPETICTHMGTAACSQYMGTLLVLTCCGVCSALLQGTTKQATCHYRNGVAAGNISHCFLLVGFFQVRKNPHLEGLQFCMKYCEGGLWMLQQQKPDFFLCFNFER